MTYILRILILIILTGFACTPAKATKSHLWGSDYLSSTRFTCIYQDKCGYIWIATEYGLNRFDGYRFTTYLHQEGNERSLPHNHIVWVDGDKNGHLWIMTAKGLAQYDYGRDDFMCYELTSGSEYRPRASRIVQDRNGQLYLGTSGYGMYEITPGQKKARHIGKFSKSNTDDYVQNMFIDNASRFWQIDNNKNLYCYGMTGRGKHPYLIFKHESTMGLPMRILQDKGTNVVIAYQKGVLEYSDNKLKAIPLHTDKISIECAIRQSGGDIILGTLGNGVYRLSAQTRRLEQIEIMNPNIDVQSSRIGALFEDKQGNLWIGCNERGLLFVSTRSTQFSQWSFTEQGVKTGNAVSSVCSDGTGGVWCSILNGKLYHFNSQGKIIDTADAPADLKYIYRDRQGNFWLTSNRSIYRFDQQTGRHTLFKTFDCDAITSLTDDGHGTLFISTEGKGLTVMSTSTGAVKQYDMYQTKDPRGYLCNNWIQSFLYDSHGLLWAGTSYGLSCYNPRRDNFKTFGWHNLLAGIACFSLAENNVGDIIIGTDAGLWLFHRKENKVEPFPAAEELKNKVIKSIVCDSHGNLWCSTSRGIYQYYAKRGNFVGHINDNGLNSKEYIARVGIFINNNILFGNSDGLTAFNPDNIRKEKKDLGQLRLVNISIGDKSINTTSMSGNKPITTSPVGESDSFQLSYADNSFTMYFSTFDYADAANIELEYKLNNENWAKTAIGLGFITFNHLQPGTYSLKVRAVENGYRSATHTYTIVIRAPWYRSNLAYTIYILLFLLFTGGIFYFYYRHRRAMLYEERMQFLINATHDIRTPLTLILSPLHKLMKTSHLPEENEALSTIDHNARRILGLVNQILDIRKIDKRQMHLQCEETALVPFINNIYKVFVPYAHEHNIDFRFEHKEEVTAWTDRTQFDKVIQNLLSNAFKFTTDDGEIVINLQKNKNQDNSETIEISVTDTGSGLRESDIPKLFNRFYQSASGLIAGKEGTGIGLNLCKMIVEMHHGTITARNRKDGQHGSMFTVRIPAGKEHLGKQEIKPERIESTAESGQDCTTGKNAGTLQRKTKYRILLVDDDAEITDYICTELNEYYRFKVCGDGKKAIKELLTNADKYDIVISDIMMPQMDGFTLLRMIKSNPQVNHIPVILLTTEVAIGNRLEGLEHGADAFIAKPFIIDELHGQIDNLIENIQRLRGKFSGRMEQNDAIEQKNIPDNDKTLMDRIMKSVNKNIGDSEYSIEKMASDAGLSRVQLYRKMKELTGLTPTEFLRNLRLEQAARLLKERKVNISQVAWSLGYNNVGHFSRIFKQHFGTTPTEYMEGNEKQNG